MLVKYFLKNTTVEIHSERFTTDFKKDASISQQMKLHELARQA